MKMKKILLVLLLSLPIYAQTEYEVVPGTKGNEVVLNIINESKDLHTENVIVKLANTPKGIELPAREGKIEKLQVGEEKEVLFTFDAKRIPGTQKDTLKFLITDNKGGNWRKEIILAYSLPREFKLEQNYPNPFNPTTAIEFTIPETGRYGLSVYNILGQLIQTISDEEYVPGYYKINFDASRFASGMYIYKLTGSNVNISKKMVFMK
jgi:hypothetical protein